MDYFALVTYLSVMIITPGPNNIMVTASGANFGYRATLPHIFGIVGGTSFQVALACLGLGAIFTEIPLLHSILSWVGLAYMLFLAWKMLGLKAAGEKQVGRPLKFIQAALFQLVNPKAWIITVTVASVFLPKTEIIFPTLIVVVTSAALTFTSTTIWSIFGSLLRNLLKNPKNQFIFNIIMAVLLLITAIMVVVK